MIESVGRYLLMRQSLGYRDLDVARDLRSFAEFAVSRGSTHLQNEDALAWVETRTKKKRRFELLAHIRRLGKYLRAEDERHQILPEEYTRPPRYVRRGPPFIYTEDETRRVMDGFARLNFRYPYDAITYCHLIGLIAVTGLRISEALNLQTADLRGETLFVRKGKFGKDRLVYLHESSVSVLQAYLQSRPANLDCTSLFVIHTNRAPAQSTVHATFRNCIKLLGIPGRCGSGPPRIHDFRHTFAVNSLAACDFDRSTVSNHAVALSTFMGHVSMESTFWYLDVTADTKERMALALEESMDD